MRLRLPAIDRIRPAPPELDISPAAGTHIGDLLARDGLAGYEPETIAAALALIEAYDIGHFIDIGANIGIYALVVKAVFGGRVGVDAFEPLPALNGIAARLAALNGLAVELHSAALSDTVGTAPFFVSAKSDTSNSLNANFRKAKGTLLVETDTLDHRFAATAPMRTLVKIDTESTEPDVLNGGLAYIRGRAPWIVCEVLYNRTEAAISRILAEIGYVAYHLTGPGMPPQPATSVQGDASYTNRDWLLAPEALSAGFFARYRAWSGALNAVGA